MMILALIVMDDGNGDVVDNVGEVDIVGEGNCGNDGDSYGGGIMMVIDVDCSS